FLAAFVPRRFEFGRCDVPVGSVFPGDGAQVLSELFQSGPTEEPVAHIDLINDETRLQYDRVGDHGIVERISVFGDVEIFLDGPTGVGEERPVSTDAAAIFIRLSDVVGAYRDQATIADLDLTMELNEPFMLPAVLGAVPSAAEQENHWIFSLQFGELPAFRGGVGKFVVREDSSWDDVRSHTQSSLHFDARRRVTLDPSSPSNRQNDAELRASCARKPLPLFRADTFQ